MIKNEALEPVFSFASQNLPAQDWKQRYAGLIALGAIIVGPERDAFKKMVMPGLQGLIGMFTDSSLKVRESLTWVIGKICEHHADILINHSDDFTGFFVNQLCVSLQDKPKISQQVCQAIDRLSESTADLNSQECESNALTPYF